MDFFAVACWAWPFTTRHGGIQRQRLSSSTILRWVSGDRERYNTVREKLTPFGLFAPDLPEAFPAGPDDVFLWSHWSDAMQRFYDVDGVPLSPFEMMHTLVPRGWRAFPFPHDAPPGRDEYFAHYQREWLVEFMARCVASLRGR